MNEEERRWEKVRAIVREECERIAVQILSVLEKHGHKNKLGFKDGRWTGVNEEQLGAWKAAYGSVDIDEELKKAAAWIVSNPHLAPKSQLGRFINTWLARTQNQTSLRSIPTSRREPERKKLCAYCDQVATGSISSTWHCRDHVFDAMNGKPIPRMMGVQAKAVAGD
jgi:hypothetical protein